MEWKIFWRLWFQKILRSVASLKAEFMAAMFTLVAVGMFDGKWHELPDGHIEWVSKISAELGMGFLGVGFIAFSTGRIIIDKLSGNGKPKKDDVEDSKFHDGDKI